MNRSARMTVVSLSAMGAGMLGLAFAAEPLYSKFCQVTGFGGTTQVAIKTSSVVTDRPVRVRFDANVDPSLPLKFSPSQEFVDTTLGKTVLAFYDVTNTSDEPVRAVASYNVAPHKVGSYFNKVECFCFKEKTFHPGKSERLPVVFYVSPELQDDRFAKDVKGVTLSYTFYQSGEAPVSASLESGTAFN